VVKRKFFAIHYLTFQKSGILSAWWGTVSLPSGIEKHHSEVIYMSEEVKVPVESVAQETKGGKVTFANEVIAIIASLLPARSRA
jgi:hypothetical protein